MKRILLLTTALSIIACMTSFACDNFRIQISDIVSPQCEQSNGKFDISIPVGTPDFNIEWTGASSGNITINGRWYSVKNIPAGSYTVRISDSGGCLAEETFIVPTGEGCISCDDFSLDLVNTNPANCATDDGQITLQINSEIQTSLITWTGVNSGSATVDTSTYRIPNLAAGTYTIIAIDDNTCSDTLQASIAEVGCGDCADFTLEVSNITPTDCASQNGAFEVNLKNGIGSFTAILNTQDTLHFNDSTYTIGNLATGNYTLLIQDAQGCELRDTLLISGCGYCTGPGVEIIQSNAPSCGQNDGSVTVKILSNTESYQLRWSRAGNGNVETSDSLYTIEGLGTGELIINVVDEYDCATSLFVLLPELLDCYTCGNLEVNLLNPSTPDCNENNGKFDVQIQEGTPDFTIAWDGPVSGSVNLSGFWYTVRNLPAGTYQVSVTETSGRSYENSITIPAEEGCDCASDIVTTSSPDCEGNNGSFEIEMSGGSGRYVIELEGEQTGTFISETSTYTFSNMPEDAYLISVRDAENADCTSEHFLYLAPTFEDCNCDELSLEFVNIVEPFCGFPSGQFDVLVSGQSDSDFDVQVISAGTIIEQKDYSFATDTMVARTFRFQNLLAREYVVLVENQEGCRTGGTFTLNEDCGTPNASNNTGANSRKMENFLAFPNPTNGQLIAQANLREASNIKLEVINAVGQVVAQFESNKCNFVRHSFDLSTQIAGVYFLKLQTEQATQVRQVVLMK